jgi:flagellar motor switch protein FliG
MSERAAKIMREDMEAMGPVRLKDVDAAQTAVVQVARTWPPRRDHAGRARRRRRVVY